MSEFFPSPPGNLPAAGPPAKRGRGRPRKERVPATPTEPTAAGVRPTDAEAKPPSPEATAFATALAALLATARWEDYGKFPRSLFLFALDVSPSESKFQAEARTAGEGLTAAFQENSAARNLVDALTLACAESARPVSFAHGRFELPRVEEGTGTWALPWLDGLEAAQREWREALTEKGIPTTDGLCVLASDFVVGDWREVKDALPGWLGRMKAMGQVVVAAAFGSADFEAAAKFSPLPVVDLKTIPLATLFRVLAASMSASLNRPGSLERLVRLELEALAARGK